MEVAAVVVVVVVVAVGILAVWSGRPMGPSQEWVSRLEMRANSRRQDNPPRSPAGFMFRRRKVSLTQNGKECNGTGRRLYRGETRDSGWDLIQCGKG